MRRSAGGEADEPHVRYTMSAADNDDPPKVLLLGDSGVGKTCWSHLTCHGVPLKVSEWTIGCTVDAAAFKDRQDEMQFVELWDVGGCGRHESSRHVFYKDASGLILVHDLTNRKSHDNLRKWIGEFAACQDGHSAFQSSPSKPRQSPIDFDVERTEMRIPMLIIGTKQDECGENRLGSLRSDIAQEYGAEHIAVNNMDVASMQPGSVNRRAVDAFFAAVHKAARSRGARGGSWR
eukprot:m.89601 g.89601  ORF g.89601 m.89601 type:complete len:234 (-) comp15229_c0_seq5:211-912(-)